MSRSPADFVTELREIAAESSQAALVVGLQASTEFVWADDLFPVASLNKHIKAGGQHHTRGHRSKR